MVDIPARTMEQPKTMRLRVHLLDQVPVLVLVVACLIAALLSNRFATPGNVTNILLQASIFSIIAIGMTFVIITGGFDLSVGSTAAMSSCVAAFVMLETGHWLPGIFAALLMGALIGIVNGLIIAYLKVNPFIATLGTMTLVRGAVLLMTHGAPVVGDGLPPDFLAWGIGRHLGIPNLAWVAIVLAAIFSWVLHRTPFGVRVFAIGDNRQAAFLSGVSVPRVLIASYALCGALAGVGGALLTSRLQSGQPTAGEFYELTVIAAVVLGGASLKGGEGFLYKSIVGVLIMTVLSNALNLINVDSYWQRVAVGIVIVMAAAIDTLRHRRA
ncbi:ribose transport system permease protein [Beijerinckia sp. 28-YEA-48]|nr:ribose transport system permease protein [Beijerinckia sp. 28-YEA-48]